MSILQHLFESFAETDEEPVLSQAYMDKMLRESLSEVQLDAMIADSFPASDPASLY